MAAARSSLVAAALLVLALACRRAGPADRQAFKVDAEPVLVWLEEHHATHGAYPPELPADLREPLERYPAFRYGASEDGAEFVLSFGDYARDGYELSWDSERGEWYLDT